MRRALLEALCLSVGLGLAFHTHSALVAAEDAKPAVHKKVGKKKKRARAAAKKPPVEKKPEPVRHEERTARADAAGAAQAAASSANAQIMKEGDTSVKVMSFEGLGIEGRLKSPQLAYFVQRVQAEFERPVLPHRSFMPELQDTTAREPVK